MFSYRERNREYRLYKSEPKASLLFVETLFSLIESIFA